MQGSDRREEVGTRGCHSPSGSGTATRRQPRCSRETLAAAPASLAIGKRKAGSLVGCIPLHQSSPPLVLQCRESQEEEEECS